MTAFLLFLVHCVCWQVHHTLVPSPWCYCGIVFYCGCFGCQGFGRQRLRLVMTLTTFCHIRLILSFNHTQHQVLTSVFLTVLLFVFMHACISLTFFKTTISLASDLFWRSENMAACDSLIENKSKSNLKLHAVFLPGSVLKHNWLNHNVGNGRNKTELSNSLTINQEWKI